MCHYCFVALRPSMSLRHQQSKLLTSIAPDNLAYLELLIKRGVASTLGEALDRCIERARTQDNRERLAEATEAYYASLSGEALAEEQVLEMAVAHGASLVDFDEEP